MDDKLLTPADVAERFQISEAVVRREAQAGRLPHVRIGRRYRFTEQHLDDYLAAVEHRPTPAPENPWGRAPRRAPQQPENPWGLKTRQRRDR